MTLRELLDKASKPPWELLEDGTVVDGGGHLVSGPVYQADALLIALAPVLAALLNDAADDWRERLGRHSMGGTPCGCSDCGAFRALLVRYGRLGEEQT